MNCSICGFKVAWCVDKDEKGTYWLCGECAASQVMETFLEKQALLRVARAVKTFGKQCGPGRSVDTTRSWFWDYELLELFEALKEVEHLL